MAVMRDTLQKFFTRLRGNPSRVFLAFALGIVLPAGFLSYLGFRSLKTEEKLLRSEAQKRYQTSAALLERLSADALRAPLNAIVELAGSVPFLRNDLPAISRQLFELHELSGAPLQDVFLFDDQSRLVFPPRQSVVAPFEAEPEWGSWTDQIRALERLEFQGKRFAEALAGYEALPLAQMAPFQAARILQAKAGLERKLGHAAAAETIYERLIREFDQVHDATGLPIGASARDLLASLLDADGENEKAAGVRIELVEGLLLQRWKSAPGRSTLLKEVTGALAQARPRIHDQGLLEKMRLMNQWQTALDAHEKNTREALRAWPEWAGELRRRGWFDRGGILRQGKGETERWVVTSPVMNSWGERLGTLAALVPSGPFRAAMQKSIDENNAAHLRVHWAEGGEKELGAFYEHDFNFLEPPMRISVSEPADGNSDRASQRRLQTYSGMLALSLLVIFIGLVLMRYGIRREMEVAAFKSDFAASVSHELRTPLASIRYIGERLARGRYRSPDEQKELYGMLNEESERLDELIEDILDFSKMQEGKHHYEKRSVDLREIVADAVERLQGKARSKGFTIAIESMPEKAQAFVDPRAAVHAAANLLDNAMKYSGDSKAVKIGVSMDVQRVGIRVRDRGIGISKDEQPRIFEKFYRARDTGRGSLSGVGLGLAMVKHMVDAHDGKITLESAPGHGSTFTLWFPRITLEGNA